jgi:hypothetical protein
MPLCFASSANEADEWPTRLPHRIAMSIWESRDLVSSGSAYPTRVASWSAAQTVSTSVWLILV